jgi:hypothetical protein
MLSCIDPNGGDKPEFGKIDAQIKERAQWRMNEVNASVCEQETKRAVRPHTQESPLS